MRRLLILTAAASLVIASAATSASARTHHHYRDTHASSVVPDGAVPADTLSAHDAYMKNIHDSGYNPHNDFDAHGVIKIN